MARAREPLAPTPYVVASDEHTLVVYVSVTQTQGTHAAAIWEQHHLREDAVQRHMATYDGDSKANHFPELVRVAHTVLETAERAWLLQREREDL